MDTATVTLHDELIDFLPKHQRQSSIVCRLNGPVSVKHLIESLGVPHTEVQHIRANDITVAFEYQVQAGDRVMVFPPHTNARFKQGALSLLPAVPNPCRFLLDNHLGRLATYLRLLGFDSHYDTSLEDAELARLSQQEQRILLTRDRRLLMRRLVKHGYCIRTREPKAQLRAVIRRFDLASKANPWQRCLHCNGCLEPVPKDKILHRLEPKTLLYYDRFQICQSCRKIYWKGSHYLHLKTFLNELGIQDTADENSDLA